MHLYQIATKIQEVIETLVSDISQELPNNAEVARSSQVPYVGINKAFLEPGRDGPTMGICDGITIFPMRPTELPGTNEREDMGYQFLVVITQGTWTEDIASTWRVGLWEQEIRRRFQQRRLGVTLDHACELGCTVTAGGLPEWARFKEGVDASYMTITCFVRESRRD